MLSARRYFPIFLGMMLLLLGLFVQSTHAQEGVASPSSATTPHSTATALPTLSDLFIVSTLDGQLFAYNAHSGQLKWTFNTGGPLVDVDTTALRHHMESATQSPPSMSGTSVQDLSQTSNAIHSFLPGLRGELYVVLPGSQTQQGDGARAKKLEVTVADVVSKSPFALPNTGGIFLGSKTNVHFVIDAFSGALNSASSSLPSTTSSNALVRPASPPLLLDIVRTDHVVQAASTSRTTHSTSAASVDEIGIEADEEPLGHKSDMPSESDDPHLGDTAQLSTASLMLRVRGQPASRDSGPRENCRPPTTLKLSGSGLAIEAYDTSSRAFLWRRRLLSPPVAIYMLQNSSSESLPLVDLQSSNGGNSATPTSTIASSSSAHLTKIFDLASPTDRDTHVIKAEVPRSGPRSSTESKIITTLPVMESKSSDGMVYVTEYDDSLAHGSAERISRQEIAVIDTHHSSNPVDAKGAKSATKSGELPRFCAWMRSSSPSENSEYPLCLIEAYELARLSAQILSEITPPPAPSTRTKLPPTIEDITKGRTTQMSGVGSRNQVGSSGFTSNRSADVAIFVPSPTAQTNELVANAASSLVHRVALDATAERILGQVLPYYADRSPAAKITDTPQLDTTGALVAFNPASTPPVDALDDMLNDLRIWAAQVQERSNAERSLIASKNSKPQATDKPSPTAVSISNPGDVTSVHLISRGPDNGETAEQIAARTAVEIIRAGLLPPTTTVSVTTSVTTVTIRGNDADAQSGQGLVSSDQINREDRPNSGSLVKTTISVNPPHTSHRYRSRRSRRRSRDEPSTEDYRLDDDDAETETDGGDDGDPHDSHESHESNDSQDSQDSQTLQGSSLMHAVERFEEWMANQCNSSDRDRFVCSLLSLIAQLISLVIQLVFVFIVYIEFSMYIVIIAVTYYYYRRKIRDNEQLYAALLQQSRHTLSLLSMTPKLHAAPPALPVVPASILSTLTEASDQLRSPGSDSNMGQSHQSSSSDESDLTQSEVQISLLKLRAPSTSGLSNTPTFSSSTDDSIPISTTSIDSSSSLLVNAPSTTVERDSVTAARSTSVLHLPNQTATSRGTTETSLLSPTGQTYPLIPLVAMNRAATSGSSPALTPVTSQPSTSFAYPLQTEESRFQSVFAIPELPPIGKGGFGIVRVCLHRIDGESYAIKQMRLWEKDQRMNELLVREVRALARLDHPNVIRYYNAWFEWLSNESDLWRMTKGRKCKGESKLQITVVGNECKESGWYDDSTDQDEDEDEDEDEDLDETVKQDEELYALSATIDSKFTYSAFEGSHVVSRLNPIEQTASESQTDDEDEDEDDDDDDLSHDGSSHTDLDVSHSTAFAQAGFGDPFMQFGMPGLPFQKPTTRQGSNSSKPSKSVIIEKEADIDDGACDASDRKCHLEETIDDKYDTENEDEDEDNDVSSSSASYVNLSRAPSELSVDRQGSYTESLTGFGFEFGPATHDNKDKVSDIEASSASEDECTTKVPNHRASNSKTPKPKTRNRLNLSRADSTTLLKFQPLQVQQLHNMALDKPSRVAPEASVNSNTSVTEQKKATDDLAARKRAEREAAALRLRERKGRPILLYIQMQYCKGGTLADWLKRSDRRIDVIENMVLFEQIANGLAHVHKKGLMHRDLKPANIFFFDTNHVRIGDFGLSIDRSSEDSVSVANLRRGPRPNFEDARTGGVLTNGVGSPLYSAPEQMEAQNHYDERADIFSLGIIFYEMHQVFSTGMERVLALTNARLGKITPSEHMSPEAVEFCSRLVRRNPKERPSAEEILTDPWVRSIRSKGPTIIY